MTNNEIRRMTQEDYEGVYGLWMRTSGMGMRSLDDSREGIAKFLRRNPSTCFVARQDDQLVGVILAGHDGRRGYIYHASVDISHRGSGLGKALVESALQALKQEGIHKVALVCYKDNSLGNRFWESTGWELRLDLNYYNLSLNEQNT